MADKRVAEKIICKYCKCVMTSKHSLNFAIPNRELRYCECVMKSKHFDNLAIPNWTMWFLCVGLLKIGFYLLYLWNLSSHVKLILPLANHIQFHFNILDMLKRKVSVWLVFDLVVLFCVLFRFYELAFSYYFLLPCTARHLKFSIISTMSPHTKHSKV